MKTILEYSDIAQQAIHRLDLPMMDHPGLSDPIIYAMDTGGKRLRPVLMLMAADAYGYDLTKVVNPAVGIEMFHNFTLLHDDVMDNSDTRRGRPTIHTKWDTNTAILAGDAMLTLSNQLISMVNEDKLSKVLETFNMAAMKIYEGQMRDMEFETSENVSIEEYMLMIEEKTGALLAASTKIGALIAGASEKDTDLFYDFGILLGKAFQIQDDYLDVYGDAATFGKPIGGDILNGKKTYLLIKALESKGLLHDELINAMALPSSQEKIDIVRNIYNNMGIKELCREEISKLTCEALKTLKETSIDKEAIKSFENLSYNLTGREK